MTAGKLARRLAVGDRRNSALRALLPHTFVWGRVDMPLENDETLTMSNVLRNLEAILRRRNWLTS